MTGNFSVAMIKTDFIVVSRIVTDDVFVKKRRTSGAHESEREEKLLLITCSLVKMLDDKTADDKTGRT